MFCFGSLFISKLFFYKQKVRTAKVALFAKTQTREDPVNFYIWKFIIFNPMTVSFFYETPLFHSFITTSYFILFYENKVTMKVVQINKMYVSWKISLRMKQYCTCSVLTIKISVAGVTRKREGCDHNSVSRKPRFQPKKNTDNSKRNYYISMWK